MTNCIILRRSNSAILVALILVIAGCDSVLDGGTDVRLETDGDAYEASTSTTVMMSIENRSDNPVYYSCAGEMLMERFEDGKLVEPNGGFPNCECLCPKAIQPGDTEVREVKFDQYLLEWIELGSNTDQTTYRLRLRLYEDETFDAELDAEDERTNEFRLQIIES